MYVFGLRRNIKYCESLRLMKSHILLENVEFFAYHGVYEEERKNGNNFVLNVKLEANLDKASVSDNLGDTINYAKVYDILEEEMKQPSNLLEHVAGRIIRRVKAEMNVEGIEVKISKKNPPIDGNVESASVVMVG